MYNWLRVGYWLPENKDNCSWILNFLLSDLAELCFFRDISESSSSSFSTAIPIGVAGLEHSPGLLILRHFGKIFAVYPKALPVTILNIIQPSCPRCVSVCPKIDTFSQWPAQLFWIILYFVTKQRFRWISDMFKKYLKLQQLQQSEWLEFSVTRNIWYTYMGFLITL